MRRGILPGFVAVFTVMLAIGWAAQKGNPAKGKVSFEQLCASCHGAAGKGDGPAAAALTPKPRNLTDKAYMGGLKDAYLEKLIKGGGQAVGKSPLMPAMGGALKDADIDNVIAYIRTLEK